jgi:class 3 adenylate cyclase/tetratricopeptide (TPR) repeat protein
VFVCSNCGFANPEGARFCNQCGSPLQTTEIRHGERRQVTVVFSDLSGFTAMSEHLDPEDVQAVMERIFSRATEIIERYSGRVDKLLGDAVMSVFGDPVSHEDDAERAVRAALEIHAAVDTLSPEFEERIGRPLQMHSGINTGVVVTSAASFDTADTGPLGDTINLAARLEDLSEAGEILLGPETAALVGNVFELDDYGVHELRGKTGSIPVVRVTGLRHERGGPSRRQAEFVGRHEELGVLLAAVERVQDGVGSVIGIRAEAGAGKTRLLDEFRLRVEEKVQWLEGRAYAYGENIPYAAVVDLISNAIGVNEDDTQNSITSKLTSGIGELVGDDPRLLDPFVRLYGLTEREGAALDKDSFQDRLLESLLAVIEGLCRRAPTVLVLQDIHWADPSTTRMIGQLVDRLSSPVVFVVNYRPSFKGSFRGLREIALDALSPRQSAEMVTSLLEGETPPSHLIEFIVDRTDGNPFYVEEIINSLVETGALARTNGAWSIEGSLETADIPTSVRGVIASRIDRLDDDRRRVLREASVVGRQFLYDVIRRVATQTETLDPSLVDLENADLIRERAQQADLEYFFKHALTQDVAYEGLLRTDRTRLHARTAAAIEAQFTGRLEEVTETLAYHYREGEVSPKAVHYLRAAGRKAVDRYALIEAEAHYRDAYELLLNSEKTPDRDRALVDLILDWAVLFYYQAHLLALGTLLEEHQDVVDRLDDPKRRMWWHIWKGHAAGSAFDQTENLRDLEEALKIAESLDDKAGIAYARTWMIWARFITGDVRGALREATSIDEWVTATRREDPYPYFKSRVASVYAACVAGRIENVRDTCEKVIAFGHEVGNNRCIAFGYQGLAFLETMLGNYQAGIDLAGKAASTAKDPIYRDTAYLGLSAAGALAGDLVVVVQAAAHLRQVIAEGTDLTAPVFATLANGTSMMAEGHLTESIELLIRARDEAKAASRVWEWLYADIYIGVTFARIATGEVSADLRTLARNPRFLPHLRRAGKEANTHLREALEESRRLEFYGVAHAVEVELAKLLLHNGEKDEARQLLQSALEFVSPCGDGEGKKRIEELLDRT